MRFTVYNCTKDDLPGSYRCVLLSTYTVGYHASGSIWFYPDEDPNQRIPYKLGLWDHSTEVNKIDTGQEDFQWPAPKVELGSPTWPRPSNFDPYHALYAFEPNAKFNKKETFPGWLSLIEDGYLVMPDLDNLHPMPDLITNQGFFETTADDAIVGRKRRKAVGEYIRNCLDKYGRGNCRTVLYGGFPIRALGKGDSKELDQMMKDHQAWIDDGVRDVWDMSAWNGFWQSWRWKTFDDSVRDARMILRTVPQNRRNPKPLGVVFRPYMDNSREKPMDYSLMTQLFDFYRRSFDFMIIWEGKPIPCNQGFWRAYSEFTGS